MLPRVELIMKPESNIESNTANTQDTAKQTCKSNQTSTSSQPENNNIEDILDDALESLELNEQENEPSEMEVERMMQKLLSLQKGSNPKDKEDEMLSSLLGALSSGQGAEEDLFADGKFDSLMDNIVSEMISKEILHEPLKDLHSKYPKWLEENSKHSNYNNYKKQHALLTEIITIFECSSYDEQKERGKVEALVDKLQELGAPPESFI